MKTSFPPAPVTVIWCSRGRRRIASSISRGRTWLCTSTVLTRRVTRHSVVRLEADGLAIGEILEVDVGALGLLVDRELNLAVGLGSGADIEQLERLLHFPLVRARDARRRVDHRAGAHLVFLAVDVAHGGVPRDHVIAGLDRVPV